MAYSIGKIEPGNAAENRRMDALLASEGIRRDVHLDYSCGVYDDGELAAVGSCFGNTLRCLAVRQDYRGEGLLAQLVSDLVQFEAARGLTRLFVYTKTKNLTYFRELGFFPVAEANGVCLLENREDGFRRFCAELESAAGQRQCAVVMNANPFTLGHRYLVEKAASENDAVHLFVLSEDRSLFPADVRLALVKAGTADLSNVIVHRSGDYIISAATFPAYFYREERDVVISHAELDAAVFVKIAQALGVTHRYVGTEREGSSTGLYNQSLLSALPAHGIGCTEIPRLCLNGVPVSAGTVRRLIHDECMSKARPLVPESTWSWLQSDAAVPVLEAIRRCGNVEHE